jgi:hypothetical protein
MKRGALDCASEYRVFHVAYRGAVAYETVIVPPGADPVSVVKAHAAGREIVDWAVEAPPSPEVTS